MIKLRRVGYAALSALNIACIAAGGYVFKVNMANGSVGDQTLYALEMRANQLYDEQFGHLHKPTITSERPKHKPANSPRPIPRPTKLPHNAMAAMTDDVMCLATNIYHEARGEKSRLGKAMVGQVTINRTKAGYRGAKTICETVFKRKQFSWTLDRPYIDLSKPSERKSFQEAMVLALALLEGKIPDRSQNAQHYYNPHKVTPKWKDAYVEVAVIGNHRFMK